MSDYKKTAAERIKFYRKIFRLNQEELSDAVGISCKHISTLENGDAAMSIETLSKLCDYFEVTPNDILLKPVTKEENKTKSKLTPEEKLMRTLVQVRRLYYLLSEGTDEAGK